MMYLRKMLFLFFCLSLGLGIGGAAETPKQTVDNSDKALQKKLHRIKRSLDPEKYQKKQGKIPESKAVSGPSTETFVKMGGGMVFVLVLMVFCLRWLKQFQKSKFLGKGGSSQAGMDVVETCFLSKDQKIVLLNVKGKELLVGVTSGQINLLKEFALTPNPLLQSPLIKKEISLSNGKSEMPGPDGKSEMQKFTENLNTYLAKYKKPKTVSQKLAEM